MKHSLYGCLASLLFLTTGCFTSQFQPIQRTTSATTPTDSSTVTIFLLERDLPPTFERLGTVSIPTGSSYFGVHQHVEDELQKVGREKGANGAIRIGHGTYEHNERGLVSYLLFRYPTTTN